MDSSFLKKLLSALFLAAVLVTPLALTLGAHAESSSQWSKEYTNLTGLGRCVIQTSDGGYAVAGVSNKEFLLLKVTASGEIQWSKTYGDGLANCVVQASDGGFVLAGNSTEFNLVKTDENGNVEWKKTYGDKAGSIFISLQALHQI
jgi:hypothetical protein